MNMNEELVKKIKELEEECVTIGTELSNIVNPNLLLEIESDFLQNFGFKIHSKKDWKIKFSETIKSIKIIMEKLLRNKRSCVFFGESASGKSSLINALLKIDLLKTDFGATSNCFVEIKSTNEKKGYIEINNQRQELEDLYHLNDFDSERKLQNGSKIEAFINKEKSPFLRQDFVLIDTPGINHVKLMDNDVNEYVVDADVVILVVNSTSIINETIKTFVNRLKNQGSKLNVFIIFNYWDIPGSRSNRETRKSIFIKEAKVLLCDIFCYENVEPDERIFFLCAEEQIMLNNNNPYSEFIIPHWEERKDSFTKFKGAFNTKIIENSFRRKRRYLEELHSQISKCLIEYEAAITFFKGEIPQFSEQIKNEFGKITNLEKEISLYASKIFENKTSEFITKAKQITTECERNEVEEVHKARQSEQIFDLLKQLINGGIEEFKETIIDYFKQKLEFNIEIRELLLKIVENIYFPLYIDAYEIPESFIENILEIQKKIKTSSIVTCGLCCLVAPVVAPVVAVTFPFLAAVLAGVGAGAGAAGVTAGAAAGIINIIDNPFEFVWKKNAQPIQSFVDSLKVTLSASYPKFIKEIQANLENKLESLNKTAFFQNELNNATSKISCFNEKCKGVEICSN